MCSGWRPCQSPSSAAVQRWLRPFQWSDGEEHSGAWQSQLQRSFASDLRLYGEEKRRREREAEEEEEGAGEGGRGSSAALSALHSPPQLLPLEEDAEGCLALVSD